MTAGISILGVDRIDQSADHSHELSFFEQKQLADCLDVSLQRVTKTLRSAERKLREHKRALVRVAREVEDPLGLISKSPAMAQLEAIRRLTKAR